MKNLNQKYGKWALITGGSTGIGREFARQLVAQGINVALVARSQDNLDALADELGKGNTRTIATDLSVPGSADKLARDVADLDIGLVIHMAGVVYMGVFTDMDADKVGEISRLNIGSTMELAHAFAPRLKARGGGGLILTSSGLAYAPVPYVAAYAASKAFVLSFGSALAHELRPAGVDVLTLVPGGTKTNMAKDIATYMDLSKLPMPMGPPAPVARAALKALGHKDVVIPGTVNRMMAFSMARLMPANFSKKMLGKMMAKGLRKQPV